MVDTSNKGSNYTKEAREFFESLGYKTWKPGRAIRYIGKKKFISYTQDIARAFDFMAWDGTTIILVQCKGGGKLKKDEMIVKADVVLAARESHASEGRKKIDRIGFPTISGVIYLVMARVPMHKHTFIIWERTAPDNWERLGERRMVTE